LNGIALKNNDAMPWNSEKVPKTEKSPRYLQESYLQKSYLQKSYRQKS
jgi:hypothetical protein